MEWGFTPFLNWLIINGRNHGVIKAGDGYMPRLELLMVLLSVKALIETDNKDKALELINEVIAEAKRKDSSSPGN